MEFLLTAVPLRTVSDLEDSVRGSSMILEIDLA